MTSWGPRPRCVDAFVDRTMCMAGLDLAAGARLDPGLSLDELLARLDGLRAKDPR